MSPIIDLVLFESEGRALSLDEKLTHARLFQPFVQADSWCPSSSRSNLSSDRLEVIKLR